MLDLGSVPRDDLFPPVETVSTTAESGPTLAMELCAGCGLAQLAVTTIVPDEPRGHESRALQEQARSAVEAVEADGWLRGSTFTEFGSPHSGSWLPLLVERGFHPTPVGASASLVLDSFAMMHEPDQRAGFLKRAAALEPDGTFLMQFQSLSAITSRGRWNTLRHGHFAYYSLTALRRLLGDVGLHIAQTWIFDLHGGSVLLAAQRDPWTSSAPGTRRLLASERAMELTNPVTLGTLQRQADRQAAELNSWLKQMHMRNRKVFAYGSASQAVALFVRAHVDRSVMAGMADGSLPAAGHRMPGTDVPIVGLDALRAAAPDCILLTAPERLHEARVQLPEFHGRWYLSPDGRNGVRFGG
ncbi:MAG: class I SAM-dependent methyltransferase [Rhodococcus sp. (in: high G+C Gram-positive bacteria)]|uniref:class I SAM-dependent methyltransferase n=1 Tax=unclassified Rhodococcus (in: high G+C Gram-positive bacteria) TaxID=192944 RepID=UPI001E5F9A79|nr:class I SAM-dependent methyltransferase [Rhodococcus sp. RDE2]BDB59349.1 transferase [Rhodococcus sp. RDE2]